jgi:hypothetical protein
VAFSRGFSNVEFNRNQFFMVGVFILLLGIQFRMVDSVTLNDKTSKFLAARAASGTTSTLASIMPTGSVPKQTLHPPQWLGWALISMGAVCILHSLAMKKPGG